MENEIIMFSDTEYIKSVEIKKQNEIDDRKKILDEIEKKITELEIKSPQDFSNSSDLLKQIKDNISKIEKYRLSLTGPMRNEITKINSAFKEITNKASIIKNLIEDKIKAYNKKLQIAAREQAEIQRKKEIEDLEKQQKESEMFSSFLNDDDQITQKENESLNTQVEMKKAAPIEIKSSFKTEKSQTIIKEKWTYEIINPDLVPRELCSPDHKKVMNMIDLGEREISGLKIYDEGTVISRNAK